MKYLFIPCCVLFACPHKASPQLMGRKEVLPHGFGAKASQIGMDCWDKRKKMGVGLSLPSPLPVFYCLVKCAPGSAAERCTLFSPNPHCSCTSSARNVGSGTGLGKHTSVYWEWLFGVCLLTCCSHISNFGIQSWIIHNYLWKSLQRKKNITPCIWTKTESVA